ncbi:MAG: lysylphosphatidylglycerol synthase domain-containing protein [Thermodesulfobacteriota bacterium]
MPETREKAQTGARRFIKPASLALVSAAILILLLSMTGVSPGRLGRALSGANAWIIVCVALFSAAWHVFVGADKLYRVLTNLVPGGRDLRFGAVLRMRLGSGPFRVLLPVDAGDVLSVLYLWRGCGAAPEAASGAVIFDRGLNLIGTGFWLMLGLGLWGNRPESSRAALGLLLAGLYCLFLFARPVHSLLIRWAGRISDKAWRIASGVLAPFSQAGLLHKLLFAAYGIVFQLRPLIVCYFLFGAFGVWLPVSSFLAPACLCVLAGHVPSAAGIGPREAAFLLFFAGAAPDPVLLSVGLLQSLTVHVIPMLCGAPWVLWYLSGLRCKPGA